MSVILFYILGLRIPFETIQEIIEEMIHDEFVTLNARIFYESIRRKKNSCLGRSHIGVSLCFRQSFTHAKLADNPFYHQIPRSIFHASHDIINL